MNTNSNSNESNEKIQEIQRRCSNKPFWIWDKLQHQQIFNQNKWNCCFNHIIGLPEKDGEPKAMFDYELKIFRILNNGEKYIWIKKATGLGITEFFLRYMAYLAITTDGNGDSVDSSLNDPKDRVIFTIVTGPRIDLAIDLIDRMKHLFNEIAFEDKNTVITLANVTIEAFPSHHLDSMRGLTNVKFIFIDEADFFPIGQQTAVRDVTERYKAKSNPTVVMVSTPNLPGGLFEAIELEPDDKCIYRKIFLPYSVGIDRIYTNQDIEQAKRSPSFEREYNLKYGYGIGNLFLPEILEKAVVLYPAIRRTTNGRTNSDATIKSMGIDPGFGSSKFAITVCEVVNSAVYVVYAQEFERPAFDMMVNIAWDLYAEYQPSNIYIDASTPELITALKERIGDRHIIDYNKTTIPAERWYQNMIVVPVNFKQEGKNMLQHFKMFVDQGWFYVDGQRYQKLVQQMRMAKTKADGNLDKTQNSLDLIDSTRLCLKHFVPKDDKET